MKLDHIIVAVSDLDQAIADFRILGFTTFFGGVHAGGETHNALICLLDGSYIELIAPTDPALPPSSSPYLGRGKGFAGYAMLVDDMAVQAAQMQARGLAFDGPKAGGRQRTDGQMLRWQTLFFADTLSPFLIIDDTPRILRVPEDADKLAHENGAQGIRQLVVAVADLAAAAARYAAILDQEPQPGPPIENAETRNFQLDGCVITIAAPLDDSGPVADHLRDYGESPFRCRIGIIDAVHAGPLDLALTHRAHFDLSLNGG